jgi:NADPH:quinone reductase-like Zn-dependent oxidoreductase
VIACFADIFALYAAGKLKPAPAETFPLERFAEALKKIETRQARGRVILLPRQ